MLQYIQVALIRALMAAELFSTASIVSLAYTAGTLVLSYLVALLIGRRVSWTDRLVLWWIVWDGLTHLTVVCDNLLRRVYHCV